MHTIGHTKILDYFKKVNEADLLSHAYLFCGQEQLGKRTVALKLAADLLNTQAEKLNTQPDFLFIDKIKDEKTGKTKKGISVDQMRQLKSFVSGTSLISGRKVVIIDDAHELSRGASNALLKTLEEPIGEVTIFLITNKKNYLPETILSRSQTIYFSLVNPDEIVKGLVEMGVTQDLAQNLSKLCWGRPGRAIGWSQDIESFEWYKKEVNRFYLLADKPFCDKIKDVEDLFGDKSDHIMAREKLDSVLEIWQVLVNDSLLKKISGSESTNVPLIASSLKSGIEIYDQINQARIDLKNNIHPRLLVENILLKIK